MQEVHEIVLLNERNIVDLPISTPKRKFKCAKSWRDCSGGGGGGERKQGRGDAVQTPFF